MTTRAASTFAMKSWEEHPYSETAEGPKLARASVSNTFQGDIEGESKLEYLMIYLDDASGTFVGLEQLDGRLGDHSGTFALQHSGTFEGTTVRATWAVVPGSGTGDLSGLRGEGGFVAEQGVPQTPCTLDYDIE